MSQLNDSIEMSEIPRRKSVRRQERGGDDMRGNSHRHHDTTSIPMVQHRAPETWLKADRKNLMKRNKISEAYVNRKIVAESKTMIEFDNQSSEPLKRLLKKMNDPSSIDEDVVDAPEVFTNITDVKNCSKGLAAKRKIARDYGLIQTRPEEFVNEKLTPKKEKNDDDDEPQKSSMMSKDNVTRAVDRVKLSLWNASLWRIQARFGSTTASYFSFLRWMNIQNLVASLFVLGLVMVPQIAYLTSIVTSEDADNDNNTLCLKMNDEKVDWYREEVASDCCSRDYEDKVQDFRLLWTEGPGPFFDSLKDVVVSLLTGSKWMESSSLFYGHYSGTFKFTFSAFEFDFPLAYFLVEFIIYIIFLSAVVISSARALHAGLQGSFTKEDGSLGIFPVLFGAWDHNITEPETVVYQHKDIAGQLRAALARKTKQLKKSELTSADKLKQRRNLIFIRILVNIFVACSLAGVALLSYYVTSEWTPRLLQENTCSSTNFIDDDISTDDLKVTIKCFLIEYLPSIVITVANLFFPFVFTTLIEYEAYKPNTKLLLNLGRCIFLRLGSLLITLLSLLDRVDCDYATGALRDGQIDIFEEDQVPSNIDHIYKACTNVNVDDKYGYCEKPICWETFVGQQFYKLTLVDLFVQIGIVFLVDAPRTYLIGHCLKNSESLRTFRNYFGVINFNVTKHVLDIVYSQTICWLAIFYAPLITLVTLLKSVVLFYLRIFYVKYLCKPAPIPYSASRASAYFKFCLLISFGCCTAAVAVFIGLVRPSTACGPFRNVECLYFDGVEETSGNGTRTQNCYVYDYVETLIHEDEREGLKDFLFLIGQTTFIYCVCGFLGLVIYLYTAIANADASLVKELKTEWSIQKAAHSKRLRELRERLQTLHFVMSNTSGSRAGSIMYDTSPRPNVNGYGENANRRQQYQHQQSRGVRDERYLRHEEDGGIGSTRAIVETNPN